MPYDLSTLQEVSLFFALMKQEVATTSPLQEFLEDCQRREIMEDTELKALEK